MAEHDQTNDKDIYEITDKVIQILLPLDSSNRLRVHRTVETFFGLERSSSKDSKGSDSEDSKIMNREPRLSRSTELTAKEFILQKKSNTDAERVACLAYYLAHYRGTKNFKTSDIRKLNTEAAQTKLSNVSHAIAASVRAGYLAEAEKGMKQLSAQGEQYVVALPDRDAANEVMPRRQKRPRRKTA